MTSFYASVSLLNLKKYDYSHRAPINCIKLTEKYHCPHGEYASARGEYFESHCSKCKHQSKIRRNIKIVDKLLRDHQCLFISWDLYHPLILFFSDGSVVSFEFNNENNTLLNVEIDETLHGKIIQSRIVDVVLCENCIFLTYIKPKLTIIHIRQDSPSLFSKIFGQKKGKLIGSEPKIINIDLFVQSSKNLRRKISLNMTKDLLLIWWKNSNTVQPWTPDTHLIKRANILIYSLKGLNIEFVCSMSAQDELLYAVFSKMHFNKFFTLEETIVENEVIIKVCLRKIIDGQCQLISVKKLPVRGSLVAFDWSTDDKLIATDSAGQLLIHDTKNSRNIVTNLEFLPKCLSWHPQDCIALIVCQNNNLMCFDSALNPIGFELWCTTLSDPRYLELSSYLHNKFFQQYFIQIVVWQKSYFNDTCLLFLDPKLSSFIILKFSFGWITRNNVSVLELISQHLKCNGVDRAIFLLKALEWTHNGDIMFQCLSKIVQYLLRKPVDSQTFSLLTKTISIYFDRLDFIPERIFDLYENKMQRLKRRLFHHLLRYHQLRKAYSLAVGLECQDLFLDLYYVAEQCNENELALAAFQKANKGTLDFNYDSSCSTCDTSASDTNSESISDSNAVSDIDILPETVPKAVTSQSSIESLESSHSMAGIPSLFQSTLADIAGIPPYFYENAIVGIPSHFQDRPADQNRFNLELGVPSAFSHSAENFACSTKENFYSYDHLSNRSKINDNYSTLEHENIKGNPSVDEENEEVEGTKIKLAHLGII